MLYIEPHKNKIAPESPKNQKDVSSSIHHQLRIAPQQHRQSVAKLLHQWPGGIRWRFFFGVKPNVIGLPYSAISEHEDVSWENPPPQPLVESAESVKLFIYPHELIGEKTL